MNPGRTCSGWRRLFLALLCTAGPAAATPPQGIAPAPADCVETLLRQLGWHIEPATSKLPAGIAAGQPCLRGSLAEAQAAGDLRLVLPTTGERSAALGQALNDPATLCAYLFRLGAATQRATGALSSNPGYRFTSLQLGWIGFGASGAPAQGWRRFRSFGRGYAPDGRNSIALQAFYSGRVRSECGVGRQVVQLATQRELYGDADFDAEFSAGELSIGTFLTLHDTDSILLGTQAGRTMADGKASKSVRLGRHALIGAPGFLAHAFDRSRLDDINNQAQNFVVSDVSADAYAALREHDGLAYYDAQNRRIWSLAGELRALHLRGFEKLLYDRDARMRSKLDPQQQALVAQLDALLADPFYAGFDVYVHRRGVKPIGYHVIRMLDRNPRTPYTTDLALHNLHTTLYWRWINRQLRDCAAVGAP